MSERRVALISLRFKPAFVSLLSAFGKAFRDLGFKVEFVVEPEYLKFSELADVAHVVSYSKACHYRQYTHAIFVNVSVQNRSFASCLKSEGAKILYVYHEPWKSSFEYFKKEGIRGGLTGALAHQVSIPMLKLADAIILPSIYGSSVYGQGDVRHNENAVYIPLLFDDEAGALSHGKLIQKEYFSYIGAICRAHAFDQFFAFMRASLDRNLGIKFLIASKTPLPSYVSKDPVINRNLDRVEIHCGRPLTNQEINKCYAASFCVWSLYRRSTQSAVLPKAFMFGAPVVANRTGAFPEFIKDGFNGRFAMANDSGAIQSALKDIRENIREYGINCRNTFLETFFYRSNLAALERLL